LTTNVSSNPRENVLLKGLTYSIWTQLPTLDSVVHLVVLTGRDVDHTIDDCMCNMNTCTASQ
jgi:hypothetical protein